MTIRTPSGARYMLLLNFLFSQPAAPFLAETAWRSFRGSHVVHLPFRRRHSFCLASTNGDESGVDFKLLKGVDDFRRDSKWQERSKRWVIIVDDEEPIRKAVGQLLFDRGYQVTVCADGPTALQVAKSGGSASAADGTSSATTANYGDGGDDGPILPDVIVSDVRMPGMDGLELLGRIRSDHKLMGVPVVLLTAKGMTQDRIAGYNAGADAYLPKPFDPEELVSILDNVIEQYEVLNGQNINIDDLKQDLDEIKYLLLEKGGGGVGNGWVEKTNIFLAPDEREVLELLCQGLMNKEIAAKTYTSTRRVEQVLTSLFRRTNVKNRTELVRWAVSTGNVQI